MCHIFHHRHLRFALASSICIIVFIAPSVSRSVFGVLSAESKASQYVADMLFSPSEYVVRVIEHRVLFRMFGSPDASAIVIFMHISAVLVTASVLLYICMTSLAVLIGRKDVRNRYNQSTCAVCKYDINGVERSPSCPECGSKIRPESGPQPICKRD